ncbi:MAG: hypothetical protein A2792_00125 [Sphingomonadales bacterium RIFCSPHIGHO2_01_FULL_65_20]|nr:MAG: hypothetical protein A2792_00125 [Sphingomonadales bacterium RIFCSPHIGHO2_01_FULL_65_20]
MPSLQIMITDAGIEAIADAQGGATDAVVIAEIGLTNTPFIMAPTIDALPGEFRRINTVAGQAVAENILHVTAYDSAAIAYDVTGFGLYAADGTLIAVYSEAEDPILSKAALATSLFAIDISIAADIAAVIEFGDPQFLNPPGTETVAGVLKISTEAQADAGLDHQTAMPPDLVKRLIEAAMPAGFIGMWSGAIVDVPDGWLLCDGTAGTPDLRNRFVVGAGDAYAVAATGGALQHDHGGATDGHALTIGEMPSHDHPNGVGDQIATAFVYGTIPASTPDNMNNDSADGTLQGMTGPTGGDGEHSHDIEQASHLPPYFALAYIMKA